MANFVSQVKLPNNTTYIIRDPNARTLDNNDFDTINVTELNAGDLIVTGVGRFTNGLYGDLNGTATQVSNNLKIQLNSGTTEGTNQFTYNGSSAKTVNITKSGIGLGNVENKSSAIIRGELTSSNVTTALGYTPLNSNLKGASNGVAELDANGLVPSSQLPSYVDDVLEYSSKSAFPTTGETGKIYVATDTNLTYRWSGSAYTEISPSLALGETSSTAYRGDRGATAYSHATDPSRLTTAMASGLYKVASTAQGHIASLTAVTKADITGLGIPGTDTNTHRPIQVNGTEILGNNTTALNLKAGTNVSLSNSSGTVTITSTDTNTTYSLSASGESVVLSGSDNTSTTADLSNAFAKYTPYKGNLSGTISSGSPAAELKTYWDDNNKVKLLSVNTAYNSAGQEYSFLLSKGNSNQYGTILRWTYANKYIEILRKSANTWGSTDWEKISAGYADTAGSATKATQDGSGNIITSTYLPLAGGTMTGTPKFATSSISEFSGNVPFILGIEAFADGGAVKWKASGNVNVGSATTAKQLSSFASISGSSHADALKMYFDKNKSNVPRNQIIDFYSTAYGNGSQYMGYFLSNYDTNPYGGFYVAHYNTPYYVGIQSGSYSQSKLGRFPTNPTSGQIIIADGTDGVLKSSGFTIATSVPSGAVFTDTKNTAGSTDTSSKIFLIGATSQAANPQTYSDNEVYTTNGVLTTKSVQLGGGSATMEYSATTKSINFVFAS